MENPENPPENPENAQNLKKTEQKNISTNNLNTNNNNYYIPQESLQNLHKFKYICSGHYRWTDFPYHNRYRNVAIQVHQLDVMESPLKFQIRYVGMVDGIGAALGANLNLRSTMMRTAHANTTRYTLRCSGQQ